MKCVVAQASCPGSDMSEPMRVTWVYGFTAFLSFFGLGRVCERKASDNSRGVEGGQCVYWFAYNSYMEYLYMMVGSRPIRIALGD